MSRSPEVQAHGELLVVQGKLKIGREVLLPHFTGPETRLCLLLNRHTYVSRPSHPWQCRCLKDMHHIEPDSLNFSKASGKVSDVA